jgi:hypothetical protein
MNLVQVIESAPFKQTPRELIQQFGVKIYIAFRFSTAICARSLCMECANKLTLVKCTRTLLHSSYDIKNTTFDFIRVVSVNEVKYVTRDGDQIDLHISCNSCSKTLWLPRRVVHDRVTDMIDAPLRKAAVCLLRDRMPDILYTQPYRRSMHAPANFTVQPAPSKTAQTLLAKRELAIEVIRNHILLHKKIDRPAHIAMRRYSLTSDDLDFADETWVELGENSPPRGAEYHPFRSIPPTREEEEEMMVADRVWREISLLNVLVDCKAVPEEYRCTSVP